MLAASDDDLANWDSINFGPKVPNPETKIPKDAAAALRHIKALFVRTTRKDLKLKNNVNVQNNIAFKPSENFYLKNFSIVSHVKVSFSICTDFFETLLTPFCKPGLARDGVEGNFTSCSSELIFQVYLIRNKNQN